MAIISACDLLLRCVVGLSVAEQELWLIGLEGRGRRDQDLKASAEDAGIVVLLTGWSCSEVAD